MSLCCCAAGGGAVSGLAEIPGAVWGLIGPGSCTLQQAITELVNFYIITSFHLLLVESTE